MPTTRRDARFLLRMAQMVLVGVALDALGLILKPKEQ